MSDLAELASELTEAQRRVLCDLPTDGSFADAYKFSRHRSVRQALNNSGCTEPERHGAVIIWCSIRPTDLGLALRAHLEADK